MELSTSVWNSLLIFFSFNKFLSPKFCSKFLYPGHQIFIQFDFSYPCSLHPLSLQLWDPEFGHAIHQYSSPRGREFIAMTTLLPPQQVAIVATSDLALRLECSDCFVWGSLSRPCCIRFIDFRINAIQHFWKLHISTGGVSVCVIYVYTYERERGGGGGGGERGRGWERADVSAGILRSLACGDNWVSVGNAGGVVSTLDLRMGGLLHQWRPSDFNLVPVTHGNASLLRLYLHVTYNVSFPDHGLE